jgi:Xaa-Pro aminopeptidase
MLTDAELGWLNDYHAKVFVIVGPLVPDDTRAWLAGQTAPILRA